MCIYTQIGPGDEFPPEDEEVEYYERDDETEYQPPVKKTIAELFGWVD